MKFIIKVGGFQLKSYPEALILKDDPNEKKGYKANTYIFCFYTDLCVMPDAFQHYPHEGGSMA